VAKAMKGKARGVGQVRLVRSGVRPVIAATIAYERWLGESVEVVEEDLRLKHAEMALSPFRFLRATFYRWVQLWEGVCQDLASVPRVLAVGDLHVENFGTWRDVEGRLVWGVNDFDEAAPMPYAMDLVRLATSALFAKEERSLTMDAASAAAVILEGYRETLQSGGKPFVLEESHPGLRRLALTSEREPTRFWAKFLDHPAVAPPKAVRRLLKRHLPGTDDLKFSRRIAGMGSLGRPRYVAIARWNGGLVAREAKAWLPSAWGWANGRPKENVDALRLLKHAVRQPDPCYTVESGWIVRRLAPHCGRIQLSQFPKRRDERRILKAMGCETANLHLATPQARDSVLHDLAGRKPDWLLEAAKAMASATENDGRDFRAGARSLKRPMRA
jgi:Uncharacterized protein conserved in bacteria (DUF2252)